METWMIAVSAVGGCIFVAFLALLIFKCCQRRKRKNNKRISKAQNGHVWQAHEKDVELGDEDDPQKRLKEDGLCKDTKAGSTFPRRIKEDTNPKAKREDGLCEDTQKRFTYPRRSKPENELLLPVEKKNLSASETALKSAFPVGVSVTTSSGGIERNVKNGADAQVHSVDHVTPKKQAKDRESSSDSSSDSDNEKRGNGTDHLLRSSDKRRRRTKRSRSFVSDRMRTESLSISLEDIPEYNKPMKRSKSNPSLVARQKMVQKDKRFESLETWRSSVPIPEPDYSNAMVISKSPVVEDDDQDNAPPSYATSDSGVECLDALSGNDDESINHCDSVPESPGIPSSQLTLRDESSFSSYKEQSSSETRYDETKHIRHTSNHGINGFQGNIVARTTKDHTALIDANVDKNLPSPSYANQQDIFLRSTPDFRTRNADLPKDDPNVALRSTSVSEKLTPASNSLSNTNDTSERIQKTEVQMDFRNVKLKPTSTNYAKDDSFTIFGSNQGSTVVVSSDKEDKEEATSVVQKQYTTKTETVSSSSQPTIISVTDGGKDHYFLDGFKKQNVITETNATQRNSPETEKRTDFHGVKLRQTSQNLKQSIAFREDMEPNIAEKQTPKNEENSTNRTIVNETESTIGVLDGIRKFQTQGAQVPKPLFGSHYISQKDPHPHLKSVNIVSREPVANLKPVNIVPPEPASIDREIHKTITISSNPSNKANEVNVIQNKNTSTITTTHVTRRPVSMHESVTSEDKRHFRYSMGNVNQGHDVTQHSNASQKTVVVIKGQDGHEKTTTREQDSLDKPVAIVTPQSPKMKRETPEERAALEEERKKNWKREQIEQKLTSAHARNQNQQFIQASGLAYKSCMPELFSKIKQIGEEKEEASTQH